MHRSDVARFLRRPAARGLSRKAKAMYEVLLACGKTDLSGELNFGTVRDAWIMAQTGYSESSVYRARKELVAAGLVVVPEQGQGRAITAYQLVLTPVGVEVELAEQRAAERAVAAGAEASTGVVVGSPAASSQASDQTALRGRPDGSDPSKPGPHTRAHPESLPGSPPLPLAGSGPGKDDAAPLRGQPSASGSAAAASGCPRAAARGKPCASCRQCGTNPRAQRRQVAAERARVTLPNRRPWAEQQAAAAQARAMVAQSEARRASQRLAFQPAERSKGGAPPGPPSAPGEAS